MSRELLEDKARRYLAEGRLTVTWVDGERVEARCRGTDREHTVTYQRGGWRCSCERFLSFRLARMSPAPAATIAPQ